METTAAAKTMKAAATSPIGTGAAAQTTAGPKSTYANAAMNVVGVPHKPR